MYTNIFLYNIRGTAMDKKDREEFNDLKARVELLSEYVMRLIKKLDGEPSEKVGEYDKP